MNCVFFLLNLKLKPNIRGVLYITRIYTCATHISKIYYKIGKENREKGKYIEYTRNILKKIDIYYQDWIKVIQSIDSEVSIQDPQKTKRKKKQKDNKHNI